MLQFAFTSPLTEAASMSTHKNNDIKYLRHYHLHSTGKTRSKFGIGSYRHVEMLNLLFLDRVQTQTQP
jgi:hypothetical protein